MHPFTPFITEEIYQSMPNKIGYIINSTWPTIDVEHKYENDKIYFDKVMDVIKAIRNIKAERGVAPSKKVNIYLVDSAVEDKDSIYIQKLAGVGEVFFIKDKSTLDSNIISLFGSYGEIAVLLGDLVDLEEEKKRLTAELKTAQSELDRATKMLSNQGFVAKAPKALIDKENQKKADYEEKVQKLKEQLEALNK